MTDTNNFDTYAQAVGFALGSVDYAKSGYVYDLDEYVSIVAEGQRKPAIGKTTSWALPLYKLVNGERVRVKHNLIVNVYGKENRKYELNSYIS